MEENPDRDVDTLKELVAVRALISSGGARSLRLAARISLGEMGRAFGSDASQISRWETAENVPREANALRYAEALRAIGWEPLD
ncbi:MAG: helix-turn-helix transcriptional regulator [Actinomycetota bacterium]